MKITIGKMAANIELFTGKGYVNVLEDAGCKVSSYTNRICFYKNSDDIANGREVAFMRDRPMFTKLTGTSSLHARRATVPHTQH